MKPRTSAVWHFFNYIDKDLAECAICNRIYSRKGRTTSSLKRHLKSSHIEEYFQCVQLEEEKQLTAETGLQTRDRNQIEVEISTTITSIKVEDGSPDINEMSMPVKVESRRSSSVEREDNPDETPLFFKALQDTNSVDINPAKLDPLIKEITQRQLRRQSTMTSQPMATKRRRSSSPRREGSSPRTNHTSATLKNPTDLTEFDITGINVANKLTKMSHIQAIYAESLINKVLRQGLLSKLTEDTDFCDARCNLTKSTSEPSARVESSRSSPQREDVVEIDLPFQ